MSRFCKYEVLVTYPFDAHFKYLLARNARKDAPNTSSKPSGAQIRY